MSNEREYDSVADRQKAAQSRVNSELTERARERIAHISLDPLRLGTADMHGGEGIPDFIIEQAISKTYEDVGYSIREDAFPNYDNPVTSHKQVLLNSDSLSVLAYIENLLETCVNTSYRRWNAAVELHFGGHPPEKKSEMTSRIETTSNKINIVLETEGILWQLDSNDGSYNFQPVGSEMMKRANEEFSVIVSGKMWKSVISPYQDAYNLYLDRTYSKEIPEKLYNSIEELVQLICVDFEGWEENRELNLSVYLDTMREMNLFEPNNIMAEELNDLTMAMERAFQKAGADRKGHSEIDREYATLMLHQVSAYLAYVIRQYEEKYGDSD